ncbi:hypothetical protein [Saccharopolyspora pogona]|uniref:hypothetical protein n=1 Tax=Saccharopolyspora pogona TaxID=333966 RepID=UPI001683A10B|nr:hypothetical protein [Saccharopolyspora pogona]
MKFTDNMVQQSQDARDQVIGLLEESKRKMFLQEVLGEIQFIGDEIQKSELERVLEISRSTGDRFVKANRTELEEHGYRTVTRAELESLARDAPKIDPKARKIALFRIDSALSFAMVLTESEPAKRLRSALVELTKVATPEQLVTAVVRSLELGDFRKTWSLFVSLPGFNKTAAASIHGKILLAATGLTSAELKETRPQIREGRKTTARNYLTDEELIEASSLEKGVYYASMNASSFREALMLGELIVDNAVRSKLA